MDTFKNLLVLGRWFIRPAFLALRQNMKLTINNSLVNFQTVYLASFSIFMGVVLMLYIFIWRPFESTLNQMVKKILYFLYM
jgi:hypothetical protein